MHYRREAKSVAATLLFMIALDQCPIQAQKTESRSEGREPAFINAPADWAERQNPYEGQSSAAMAGKKLFRRYCAACHSPHGDGTMRAPSLASGPVQDAEPGALFWFLTNGDLKRGMPSWSGLPAERRWQLVTYLKSLSAGSTHDRDKP